MDKVWLNVNRKINTEILFNIVYLKINFIFIIIQILKKKKKKNNVPP